MKKAILPSENLEDSIIEALQLNSSGLSRTDINNYFAKHKSSISIIRSLKILLSEGIIFGYKKRTRGRIKTIFKLL